MIGTARHGDRYPAFGLSHRPGNPSLKPAGNRALIGTFHNRHISHAALVAKGPLPTSAETAPGHEIRMR